MRSWVTGLGVLPSIPKARETQHSAVPRTDEIRLLAIRPFKPLIIAAGRNDAPMALERVPEHGLIGNALGARVEACRQLLQGLFPPPWNEPPAHRRLDGSSSSRSSNRPHSQPMCAGHACQSI